MLVEVRVSYCTVYLKTEDILDIYQQGQLRYLQYQVSCYNLFTIT